MFYKISISKYSEVANGGTFCKKMCSKKFRKFRRKIPVPESLFNFIKKETLAQVFSSRFYKISKNTFLQNTSVRLVLNIQGKTPLRECLFYKVSTCKLVILLKMRLRHRCFPVTFVKFPHSCFCSFPPVILILTLLSGSI